VANKAVIPKAKKKNKYQNKTKQKLKLKFICSEGVTVLGSIPKTTASAVAL
jgi:hypothetical protein